MVPRIGLKPSGADNATARCRRMSERSFSAARAACDCTNAPKSTWTSAFACLTVAPGFNLASRFNELKSIADRCTSLIIMRSGNMRSGTRPCVAPS